MYSFPPSLFLFHPFFSSLSLIFLPLSFPLCLPVVSNSLLSPFPDTFIAFSLPRHISLAQLVQKTQISVIALCFPALTSAEL